MYSSVTPVSTTADSLGSTIFGVWGRPLGLESMSRPCGDRFLRLSLPVLPFRDGLRRLRRTGGIGNWQLIMDATTLTAVATNCLLFTISSEQLMQWVPQWYMDMGGPDSPADQQFELGKGRYVLGLCFAINQVLLAMVGFLWVGIPSMPRWVRQKVSRVHYLRERGARAASMKKRD